MSSLLYFWFCWFFVFRWFGVFRWFRTIFMVCIMFFWLKISWKFNFSTEKNLTLDFSAAVPLLPFKKKQIKTGIAAKSCRTFELSACPLFLSHSYWLKINQNGVFVFAFFMERRERAQERWSGGCFLFLFLFISL
jgi:hypothetical protein